MKNIFKIIVTILVMVSFVKAENISAYFSAKYNTPKKVENKLKKVGFKILSIAELIPGRTTITITNNNLKNSNTFVAAINVFINGKDIRVQNPDYFGRAYLGKNYKEGQFNSTIQALANALGELKTTPDVLDSDKLPHYHFMFAMPYFEDTITVGEGDVKSKLNNSDILYKLALPNGNILVGHKLSQKTRNFVKKIGQEDNAALLPYQSMISGNKAYIMDPKYYIALSFPLLKMSHFMKISSVPGEIENEIKNVYK